MVVEREPPKAQSSPAKKAQDIQPKSPTPVFGEASSLQSPLRQNGLGGTTNIFNIPKPNRPRPEHHRPIPRPPSETSRPSPPAFRNPLALRPPVVDASNNDSAVKVPKPENPRTFATHPEPPRMFSSLDPVTGGFTAVNQFTNNGVSFTDPALLYSKEDRFGAPDPMEYVDAEKANREIKALLEAAFEDDEDKPRTRERKKRVEKTGELTDKMKSLSTEDKPETTEDTDAEEEEGFDDGTVEGLKVKLLPHQIDGVEWMLEKEMGKRKIKGKHPKGGLLADDMGLGKTIQMISLILTHTRPSITYSDDESGRSNPKNQLTKNVGKGTLVIAPLALIKQWEGELDTKVEDSHKLKVLVHHGPQRTRRPQDLEKYDVVITTYQTLVSEHGNSSDELKVGCFGVHWFRVVLDEAHTIKNKKAKATQACRHLRSEYRWCLTGTPLQNNLDELQSLISFLRIKPYDDISVWREQITRPLSNGRGGMAIRRLQYYLKAFMKRRTKDVLKVEGGLQARGKGDGQKDVGHTFQITERKIEKVVSRFTPKEQSYYDKLQSRTDKSIAKLMEDAKMNYASALVLLLRLRQACDHAQLIEKSLTKYRDNYTICPARIKDNPSKNQASDDVDEVADLLGGLNVGVTQCEVCQFELSPEEVASKQARCEICQGDLEELLTAESSKSKSKKKVKAKNKERRARRRQIIDSDDEEEGDWVVPKGERSVDSLGRAGGSDDENVEGGGEWLASDDSETGEEESVVVAGSHQKKKPKAANLDSADGDESEGESNDDDSAAESDPDASDEASTDDSDASGSSRAATQQLILSTKIRDLLRILRRESAAHKFIVFSQFTTMLDLVEPFLRRHGVRFTRYDGSMRNDAREASLHRLRTDPKTRVLLCSLKCGALGLNLTAASRVVILEPFWNPFIEDQAIDRVHRLNQTQDVTVYKLTIADTVEERIFELQEKKRALAEAAIEGKAAAAKLSMRELLGLFKHDGDVGQRGAGGASAGGRGVDDHAGLMDRVKVLRGGSPWTSEGNSGNGSGAGGSATALGSGRVEGGRSGNAMKEKKGGNKVAESSVFGRRW